MKLARFSSSDLNRGHTFEASQSRSHDIICKITQARWIPFVGCQAIARNWKDCKSEPFHSTDRSGGRKGRDDLSKPVLRQLQRSEDINPPIKKQTDIAATALG